MPFNLIDSDYSPVVFDREYEVVNKDLLAQYVTELLLGHHFHILRILRSLSSTPPVHKNESIQHIINTINDTSEVKRDGWFFQMISWIVLAKRNTTVKFHSNYPQFAPAQHGIDGLAIVLNDDNSLRSIIITEDKCTTKPRNKITSQVFPEFVDFENGEKDNALVSIISTLIGQLEGGDVLESVQNNIFDTSYRLYRIGITRENSHNSPEGRKALFLNYEKNVGGTNPMRRSASTIYLPEMRLWMSDFSNKVVANLEDKKTHV